jgi:hypothetical protein
MKRLLEWHAMARVPTHYCAHAREGGCAERATMLWHACQRVPAPPHVSSGLSTGLAFCELTNHGATIIWHTARMPEEYDLTLLHPDGKLGRDIAIMRAEIEELHAKLARMPACDRPRGTRDHLLDGDNHHLARVVVPDALSARPALSGGGLRSNSDMSKRETPMTRRY